MIVTCVDISSGKAYTPKAQPSDNVVSVKNQLRTLMGRKDVPMAFYKAKRSGQQLQLRGATGEEHSSWIKDDGIKAIVSDPGNVFQNEDRLDKCGIAEDSDGQAQILFQVDQGRLQNAMQVFEALVCVLATLAIVGQLCVTLATGEVHLLEVLFNLPQEVKLTLLFGPRRQQLHERITITFAYLALVWLLVACLALSSYDATASMKLVCDTYKLVAGAKGFFVLLTSEA